MSAHTAIAHMKKMSEETIQALRDGTPLPDAKHEALRKFALAVVDKRGNVNDAEKSAFLDAGYTHEHMLDVCVGASFATLMNYSNDVMKVPLDDAWQKTKWEKSS